MRVEGTAGTLTAFTKITYSPYWMSVASTPTIPKRNISARRLCPLMSFLRFMLVLCWLGAMRHSDVGAISRVCSSVVCVGIFWFISPMKSSTSSRPSLFSEEVMKTGGSSSHSLYNSFL